jgi:hypothetical protein
MAAKTAAIPKAKATNATRRTSSAGGSEACDQTDEESISVKSVREHGHQQRPEGCCAILLGGDVYASTLLPRSTRSAARLSHELYELRRRLATPALGDNNANHVGPANPLGQLVY